MKLSVVIPARNEAGCIDRTVRDLHSHLAQRDIDHEIVVVNDNSTDETPHIAALLEAEIPAVRLVHNTPPNGFGFAVRRGLENACGDAIAIYMADASDSPADLQRFFETLQAENVDCVFGTRFHRDSRVVDYPGFKLFLNRTANFFIRVLFGLRYNDMTNAFKLYRREVIQGIQPLLSQHFNITVEIPLKAIVRGYSYRVVPNDWFNRRSGESKLKIREMGSRYLFIVLYCLLEKWLSRGDYHRENRHRLP
ncbi:MAG: glycosyltransferase family 2 protein [Gammaproteobacteria bacterium]|nr:glycosyltransferase family 2 protein [Gammaproteobacteria bacterium]